MQKGYQVTFFTQQERLHGRRPLAQWLIEEARKLGVRGATLNGALVGFGHDGQIHWMNILDFSEQPVQVTLILSQEEERGLFAHLEQQQVEVFFVRSPVEFGNLGRI
ncbi:DUF190 domain-containing protein [Pseudomonas brenneri]|uniref:DUF190 domain-containing protein n=1 Tax=Pseudomonas brenneri TaxID=129817 RepID=UPI0035716BD6